MTDLLLQLFIGLTGALGVFLAMRNDQWGRWGGIVGLIGQPAWLWCTYAASQWGMFVSALVWTLVWLNAIWLAWIRPPLDRRVHANRAD